MMLTVEEYMALRRLIDSERESEGSVEAAKMLTTSAGPKRKVSKYNRKYRAAFKKVSSTYKLKSGKWKKNGFRAAVKAAHKMAGGKK
tara:strand:+ start:751 stop:1011 length:261 start_codon:yes stop_codon:yes gene_type:complete